MSRTLFQIYDSITTEKQTMTTLNGLLPSIDDSQTLLTDLTTASRVAIWRLWAFIIAVAIWTHENIWDKFKEEIEVLVASIIPGTTIWYRDQALKFQYQYDASVPPSFNYYQLQYINGKYQYSTIDATKRIITQVAVIEVNGLLIFKLSKASGPLNSDELLAFFEYMRKVRFAGTNFQIISANPDLLKIAYDVYYDPLVPLPTVKTGVETAINDFISSLPFDGKLNLTKLTSKIEEAYGVVDPILTTAEAKYGSIPYTAIIKNYTANAGIMIIDPAFPLSSQINYIPNV